MAYPSSLSSLFSLNIINELPLNYHITTNMENNRNNIDTTTSCESFSMMKLMEGGTRGGGGGGGEVLNEIECKTLVAITRLPGHISTKEAMEELRYCYYELYELYYPYHS